MTEPRHLHLVRAYDRVSRAAEPLGVWALIITLLSLGLWWAVLVVAFSI